MTNLLLKTQPKQKNQKELYKKYIINPFKCVISAFEVFKLKNISTKDCDNQNKTIGSMKVEREEANGKFIPTTQKTHKVGKCKNGILNTNLPFPTYQNQFNASWAFSKS